MSALIGFLMIFLVGVSSLIGLFMISLKEKTLDQLTPTEFQVLRLIGQGKSNDEIAMAMFISKNTVRSHIKSIYAKLDTHSRLQLALYAINSALF